MAAPTPTLQLPTIAATANPALDAAVLRRIGPRGFAPQALGHLQTLVLQLARVQGAGALGFDLLAFDSPQVVVFAGDHGIVDEGVSATPPGATRQRVLEILRAQAPINTVAQLQGFDLTVVDAGVASNLGEGGDAAGIHSGGATAVALLLRKIAHGTRNMTMGPAMSLAQAVAALHAGMDVVRHLPGNVVALGEVGAGNSACAALLLSRLCGVPLADACGQDMVEFGWQPPSLARSNRLAGNKPAKTRLEVLRAAAHRHRQATSPLAAMAALGGFEIAMMVGAMLQAASERRVVLVDGFAAGSAALVARGLNPAVTDYLVFTHRAAHPGHRLLLLHMQAQPLMDLALLLGQGVGSLLAWPMLQTVQALLEHGEANEPGVVEPWLGSLY